MRLPSVREQARKGLPVHARRVPVAVIQALHREAMRTERTLDHVITQILVYWYEDGLRAEEDEKKRLLRAAGVDGKRVG